jgi:hypothetical protein
MHSIICPRGYKIRHSIPAVIWKGTPTTGSFGVTIRTVANLLPNIAAFRDAPVDSHPVTSLRFGLRRSTKPLRDNAGQVVKPLRPESEDEMDEAVPFFRAPYSAAPRGRISWSEHVWPFTTLGPSLIAHGSPCLHSTRTAVSRRLAPVPGRLPKGLHGERGRKGAV